MNQWNRRSSARTLFSICSDDMYDSRCSAYGKLLCVVQSKVVFGCCVMIDDGLNSSGYVLTTLSTGTYDDLYSTVR